MARRRPLTPHVLLAVVAALTASGCTDQTPLSPDGPSTRRVGVRTVPVAGRYLVGFAGRPAIAPAVMAAAGGRIVDRIPALGVLVVDGVTNPDALRAARPRYIEAEFETTVAPIRERDAGVLAVPEALDAAWHESGVQWDMQAMHADDGWEMTDGGAGINVCTVDTGVDDQHQELAGKVLLRTNFVTDEPRVDDPNGHGTHVSGTMAAKGMVVAGVAPRASVLSARVLNAAGVGGETAILNGIVWCADNGAHVINMSLGAIRYLGVPSTVTSFITYRLAIDYAAAQGAVTVTSAGNSNLYMPNPQQIALPSAVPNQLTVGATGPLSRSTAPAPPAWNPFDPAQVWQGPDTKAFYSNFGPAIDVFAPGGRGGVPLSSPYRFFDRIPQGLPQDNIYSLCSGQSNQTGLLDAGGVPSAPGPCLGATDRYIAYAGTSMAAPHVAGLAAVLYAELGGVRSDANRLRVIGCILDNTDDIGDPGIYGGGRVNVQKAVAALRAGSC